jgi:nicotinate phosphoribosyltransferase
VKIFASGDLDEYKVEELIRNGAAIDAFGVGTRMSTSYDRPYVDVVYKLSGKVEGGTFVPAMKLSKGKVTLPGKKQIFRQRDHMGMYARDIIGLEDEKISGEPLLVKVMENGEIVGELPSLEEIRSYALKSLSELPEKYKRLRNAAKYPVRLSPKLREIKRKLEDQLKNVNKI